MRLLRCIMLVLLTINLPGYGWAFAAMPACSMQHAQSMAASGDNSVGSVHDTSHGASHRISRNTPRGASDNTSADAANVHAMSMADAQTSAHCCADLATTHLTSTHGDKATGHGCSNGVDCQCGAVYQTVQPLTAQVIPAAHHVAHSAPFRSITTVAQPLWRPPTLG